MTKPFIRLNPADNVVVALKDMKRGDTIEVDGTAITLLNDILFEHKVAVCDIAEGENVLKYGLPVGHATHKIAAGEHVHEHNLTSNYIIK